MTGALILTWNGYEPGQASGSIHLLRRTFEFLDSLIDAGRVSARKIYMTPLGGPRRGLIVVEGELEHLNELFWSKEYRLLHVEAELSLRGFEATIAVGGEPEAVAGPAALFAEVAARVPPRSSP